MQLDALKAYPNVLVLTTSNITGAIDLAFVDRADIKAYVGPPGLQVSLALSLAWANTRERQGNNLLQSEVGSRNAPLRRHATRS